MSDQEGSAAESRRSVGTLTHILDRAALGELIDGSSHGIAVRDSDGRYLYLNDTALSMVGATHYDQAVDILTHHSHWTPANVAVTTADGTKHEIDYDRRDLTVDGRTVVVVVLHQLGPHRLQDRRLTAFARAAHSVAFANTLSQSLNAIADEIVRATGLAAAQILLIDPITMRMSVTGAAGTTHVPEDFTARHEQIRGRGGNLLSLTAMTRRRPEIARDRRRILLADPVWEPLREWFASFEWSDFVAIPLIVRERNFGALNAYCQPDWHPTAADVDFLQAMSDQAALAIDNARLLDDAKQKSELEERQRIARDLHDAVAQQLFTLTLHAKAIELAHEQRDLTGVLENVGELTALAQSALADMRGLLTRLYPSALTSRGLAEAVGGYARRLAERSGVTTELAMPPERLLLDLPVEENA